jgi:hypothetical protein
MRRPGDPLRFKASDSRFVAPPELVLAARPPRAVEDERPSRAPTSTPDNPGISENDLGKFAPDGKKTRTTRAKVPSNAEFPRKGSSRHGRMCHKSDMCDASDGASALRPRSAWRERAQKASGSVLRSPTDTGFDFDLAQRTSAGSESGKAGAGCCDSLVGGR